MYERVFDCIVVLLMRVLFVLVCFIYAYAPRDNGSSPVGNGFGGILFHIVGTRETKHFCVEKCGLTVEIQ